jgi:formylglycine-generating enzyme required for sulfatase activity
MKHGQLFAMLGLIAGLVAQRSYAGWPGDPAKCKADAVKAGSVCIDKYEASVWQIPPNARLIKKVQNGTVTSADLTAGGATQISPAHSCSPAFPATFPANGQWTEPLYAMSIPGVQPTACITWLQAQQACGNSRKRLPTNAEWQLAVAGTPDPGPDNGTTDCNTFAAGTVINTGARSSCVSNWGAFDMVGNVDEWVADWVPLSTNCVGWGSFSNDRQCLAGADTSSTDGPGALLRGGNGGSGTGAGPLSITGFYEPSSNGSFSYIGFRCAR